MKRIPHGFDSHDEYDVACRNGYCGMFADYDSLSEAYNSAVDYAEDGTKVSAITAIGILTNAFAKKVAKLEVGGVDEK